MLLNGLDILVGADCMRQDVNLVDVQMENVLEMEV